SAANLRPPSPACRGGSGWGAVASARRSALLHPGPLWRGVRVKESPQDGSHGCEPVFRRHTEVPSETPGTRPRTRSPWMGAGRAIGVSFPLGYFSFGQAKEK